LGDKINGNEIGEACCTYGGEDRLIIIIIIIIIIINFNWVVLPGGSGFFYV